MANTPTNILLVDDEPDIIFFLSGLLKQQEGFQVTSVADGRQALEVIVRTSIDVLVTDIRMPGMDGIELVKQAMAIAPDLQCIVLTGHGDIGTAILTMQAGAINYLQKPINFDELLLAIDRGLEKRQLLLANRQYQQELVEARDAAEAGNRAKTEFLANISHEMRTPMTGILGFSEMLLANNLVPEQKEQVLLIQKCAQRLHRLIRNALDFTKLEKRTLSLDHQSFVLADLLSSSLAPLSIKAAEKGLALTWKIGPEVAPILKGDGRRFCLIVEELAENAIKFGGQGVIAITLSVDSKQDGKEVVRVVVADQGPGISPADQHRIFQTFVQLDGSITREQGGTGIGLALCRKLVELMGGRIWVESAVGKGSTFSFTVSLEVGPTPVKGPASLPAVTEDSLPLSLLLVDDDPLLRELGQAILASKGFTVLTADNGLMALQILSKVDVDLVLIDVQMPVMDGLKATRFIRRCEVGAEPEENKDASLFSELSARRRGSHLPIIGVTGHADFSECTRAGMDGYLGKPFDVAEAMNRIGQLLGSTHQFKSMSESCHA